MEVPGEIQIKEKRLQQALDAHGYDAIIITHRDQYAWITGGADAVSSRVSPTSPVFLVITPSRRYAVGYSMDLPYAMDAGLDALDYEPVPLAAFGPAPDETALSLSSGRLAADADLPGATNEYELLVSLHEPLTPAEMARYREMAIEGAEILKDVANWVQPGMTERQVLAYMWRLYLERGFEGHYMFAGADERIKKYRHPVPGDATIRDAILIAPAVVRSGLLLACSRLIYFKEPAADIRRRFQAVATMQAAMVAGLRPGTPLLDLRNTFMSLFEELGFAEERTKHFHGGPIGYWNSYAERMRGDEVVKNKTAYTFYFTVAGVKSEELILVDEQGAAIVSADSEWPLLSIVYGDQVVGIPDILVRN
jgi:Xaa-Pro dipeptidase